MKITFRLSFFLVAALLILHAVLGLDTIDSLSPTNDETIYLTSGYSQLKTGDYRMNPDHPPFAAMWSALPLLLMNPKLDIKHPLWENLSSGLSAQYIFSDLFFYNGAVDSEEMLKAGRCMTLLLSLVLGLAVYFWVKGLSGQGAGFLALFLWCFSSAFLGHGTLATNDMALTLFCFTTLYFFWLWYKRIRPLSTENPGSDVSIRSQIETQDRKGQSIPDGSCRAVLTGVSLGLALGSKHSAVTILPIMGLIILWILWENERFDLNGVYLKFKKLFSNSSSSNSKASRFAEASQDTSKDAPPLASNGTKCETLSDDLIKNVLIALVSCLAVLLVLYQFKSFFVYLTSIKNQFSAVATGHRSFFLGRYSDTGWLLYFPVAFLIKTPLPFIFLLGAAFLQKRLWNKERVFFLLLPVLVFFLLSCFSKKQIGHRYILPIYPFLIVWISGLYPYINRLSYKAAVFLLLAWYAVMCVRTNPWHLSYYNELIGSQDNGYKYLTDSNVDWGQGLKALGKYLNERSIPKIYLSYCGVGDPHYYGIDYIPLYPINDLFSTYITNHRLGLDTDYKIQGGTENNMFFAISANNLQSTYYGDKKLFAWLKEIPCEDMLARSILIYNLSKYPLQYEKLIAMVKNDGTLWERGFQLQTAGKPHDAISCYKNFLSLNPQNPQVWYNLAYAQEETGDTAGALNSLENVIKLAPGHRDAQLLLSVCYEKLGNKTLSQKYRKIYEKNNAL